MGERRFALALFLPALVLLVATTTLPLVYLVWASLQRIDLSMPWLTGFAGLENYAKLGGDARFWHSLGAAQDQLLDAPVQFDVVGGQRIGFAGFRERGLLCRAGCRPEQQSGRGWYSP